MRVLILIIIPICFICYNYNSQKKSVFAIKYNGQEGDIGTHIEYDSTIAYIDYKMSGCFGSAAYKMSIVKSKEKMIAIFNSHQRNYFTVLDSDKINAFNKFISELKTIEFSFGCTTTEYYIVQIRKEKFEIEDGGCVWNGFDKLRKDLSFEKTMTY